MDDILISGKRLGPLETNKKNNRNVVPILEKSDQDKEEPNPTIPIKKLQI